MAQEVEVKPHRYNTVAASATNQALVGAANTGPGGVAAAGTGAVGDVLDGLLIMPGTAAAGAVTLTDGSTSIAVFAGGGTTALTSLWPVYVPIDARSQNGPWKVTTGTNVTVLACGHFT